MAPVARALALSAMLGALSALAASGCLPGSSTVNAYGIAPAIDANGRFSGVHAVAMGGEAGFRLSAEAGFGRVSREEDPTRRNGSEFGLSLGLSPIALLARDHRLERYFDAGVSAGFGGGIASRPGGALAYSHGWVGAWIEAGTIELGGGFLTFTAEIRRAERGNTVDDAILVLPGIAWTQHGIDETGWRD